MGTSKNLGEFQVLVSAMKKIKVGKGLESGQRKGTEWSEKGGHCIGTQGGQ